MTRRDSANPGNRSRGGEGQRLRAGGGRPRPAGRPALLVSLATVWRFDEQRATRMTPDSSLGAPDAALPPSRAARMCGGGVTSAPRGIRVPAVGAWLGRLRRFLVEARVLPGRHARPSPPAPVPAQPPAPPLGRPRPCRDRALRRCRRRRRRVLASDDACLCAERGPTSRRRVRLELALAPAAHPARPGQADGSSESVRWQPCRPVAGQSGANLAGHFKFTALVSQVPSAATAYATWPHPVCGFRARFGLELPLHCNAH